MKHVRIGRHYPNRLFSRRCVRVSERRQSRPRRLREKTGYIPAEVSAFSAKVLNIVKRLPPMGSTTLGNPTLQWA